MLAGETSSSSGLLASALSDAGSDALVGSPNWLSESGDKVRGDNVVCEPYIGDSLDGEGEYWEPPERMLRAPRVVLVERDDCDRGTCRSRGGGWGVLRVIGR